jgi:hypothetical protein
MIPLIKRVIIKLAEADKRTLDITIGMLKKITLRPAMTSCG